MFNLYEKFEPMKMATCHMWACQAILAKSASASTQIFPSCPIQLPRAISNSRLANPISQMSSRRYVA
jgi:hypothetical protein